MKIIFELHKIFVYVLAQLPRFCCPFPLNNFIEPLSSREIASGHKPVHGTHICYEIMKGKNESH